MQVSLRQLEAFCAVARHASFTRAAEQLHVTQAGLSAMVRELEAQVSCRLFQRTTRRVSLTEAGERLLPVARRHVQDITAAVHDLRATGHQSQARLRVGMTPLMASSVAPAALHTLAGLRPDARIEVLDVDRDTIRQHVEAGELDLGLGAFFGRTVGIRRQSILPARLVLAVPADRAGAARAQHWKTLQTDRLLALPAHNPIQQLADRYQQIEPGAQRRVVTHLETALAWVSGGLGEAILPSFASVAAARWSLAMIPLTPAARCDYYAITPAGEPVSPLAQAFIESFKQALREAMRP